MSLKISGLKSPTKVKSKAKKTSYLVKSLLFGTIVLAGYCLMTYQYIFNMMIDRVDEKLYVTAIGVENIINEYPGAVANSEKKIPADFQMLSTRLTEYAEMSDVTFIYTLEFFKNQLVFTSYNNLKWQVDNALEQSFMDPYVEASPELVALFTESEEVKTYYETAHDKWGEFRTVLLLSETEDGRRRYIGVDTPPSEISEVARKSFITSLVTGTYFSAVIIIISFAYNRVMKKRLAQNSITKFPNKNALQVRLELNSSQDENILAFVGCLGLAEVETLYGQDLIHDCIKKVLEHFSEHLGKSCSYYHISSSRIAILLEDKGFEKEFISRLKSIHVPSPILEHPFIDISIKIGIATGTYPDIVRNASLAEISIRKDPRTSFILYSDQESGIREQYEKNIRMDDEVNNAFKNNQFLPFFQPIISAKTGEVIKHEALARMQNAKSEIVVPYFFLPFIKGTPLSKELAKVIFRECRERFNNTDIEWSFNITAADMSDPELFSWLINEIGYYSKPENITMEVLETEEITDYQAMANCIEQYHDLGVTIYIDDFGTGYSNYSHFLKMKVDGLKIDGSLIKDINQDIEIRMFVESLVKFTHALNMIVVTEFVENGEILEIVKSLGVDLLQGYHFSAPAKKIAQIENYPI